MTTKSRRSRDEPHEPAWLGELDAKLGAVGRVTMHSPNLIEFSSDGGLVTRVRLRGHGVLGESGTRLEAVAEVTTPLPDTEVSPPSEVIELCNRMAVSSALVAGAAGGVARACARISFPAGEPVTTRFYLELLFAAALQQAPWLDRCMAYLGGRESKRDGSAPDPPARVTQTSIARELEKAEKRLDALDIFCDSDGRALQAEFTWDEGVGRTPHGDRSSRFRVETSSGHSLFGAGFAYELELPEELGRAHAIASALNEFEVSAEDAVPLLGAWCRTLDGRGVAHVGFVPNAAYSEGLAANLSVWAFERSRWARARILALGGE